MKSTSQLLKSSVNSKPKKSSKDRDKRKSQGSSEVNNHTSNEKGTPTKETSNRQYAGLDSDCLNVYGEQVSENYLSKEITKTLSEDINYKLRYIINDALLRARLQGRNAISPHDLDECFENLGIDKIYGASSSPEWIPFCYQNLYYLNDTQVNLSSIAESEELYEQAGDPIFTKAWMPEQPEISKSLKNYFTVMCESIVNNNIKIRELALKNIGQNSHIGPIVEWFYNFCYILLSKNITYDCLTLRALDLIWVLENTTIGRINVSERQLRLLIRLLLQRLLKSSTRIDVLQPMCSILVLLCNRMPLKEFVMAKIAQKLLEIFPTHSLTIIYLINNLGSDAVEQFFIPNMNLFLTQVIEREEPDLTYSILEVFNIMYKDGLITNAIYDAFCETFGDVLVIFSRQAHSTIKAPDKKDFNPARMKYQLFKSCRKLPQIKTKITKYIGMFEKPSLLKSRKLERLQKSKENLDFWSPLSIKGVFETSNPRKLTPEKELLKITWKKTRKQERHSLPKTLTKQTNVIIGKTSFLLPVFKQKVYPLHSKKCCDHSLLWYNI